MFGILILIIGMVAVAYLVFTYMNSSTSGTKHAVEYGTGLKEVTPTAFNQGTEQVGNLDIITSTLRHDPLSQSNVRKTEIPLQAPEGETTVFRPEIYQAIAGGIRGTGEVVYTTGLRKPSHINPLDIIPRPIR